ncbi:MAG: rSAM/selenodomain-associated transferase 1 [Pseudohongiellaceae bacterium]|jgi:rSAM/selenodomain-associated transferase 1
MKKNMTDLLIIQFAKWPVLGNVKTRLASSIGDTKALRVHLDLMSEVLTTLISAQYEGLTCDIELWLNEIPENTKQMTQIITTTRENEIPCKEQKGHNLGDKMADAMTSSLQSYSKVLIVGSDCPNITVTALKAASEALNTTDIVLGPAEDGGYVLVGASNFNAQVFKDVEWGKGKVFDTTVNNIRALNLSFSLIDESWDVDDLADYERWCASKLS